MQQNFTISLIINKWESSKVARSLQTLTQFKDGQSSLFSTFNEQIDIKENDYGNLSFSIMRNVEGRLNPFFRYIVFGRELQLYYDNKYYYFVITNISPVFTENNIQYNVSCQDSFSYYLSKNNVEANYKDEEDAITFEWSGKNIRQLADKILNMSNLPDWQIDKNLEAFLNGYSNFPSSLYGVYDVLRSTTSTLELEGSNTYNGLVEIANLFNAVIEVDYPSNPNDKRTINFRNRNHPRNSLIKLRPSVNLNALNLSQQAEDFCTVLHVSGAEDANEELVSIIGDIPQNIHVKLLEIWKEEEGYWFNDLYKNIALPTGNYTRISSFSNDDKTIYAEFFGTVKQIPGFNSTLFNFDYLVNSGTMPKDAENELYKILLGKYFDANLRIRLYSGVYYNVLRAATRQLNEERTYIAAIAANQAELAYAFQNDTLDKNVMIDEETNSITDSDKNSLYSYKTKQEEIDGEIENNLNYLYNLWRYGSGEQNAEEIQTYNYMSAQMAINGKEFIEQRINEWNTTLQEKLAEYNSNINEMKSLIQQINSLAETTLNANEFGLVTEGNYEYAIIPKEESLKTIETTIDDECVSLMVNYENLYQKTVDLALYLGQRVENAIDDSQEEYYFCKGICEIYIEQLNNLKNIVNNSLTDSDGNDKELDDSQEELYELYHSAESSSIEWIEFYNQAIIQRDNAWSEIMTKFSNFIIEGTYSDENQLDRSGLYSSAIAQFTKINKPVYTYSATMLDWQLVSNTYVDLKVGNYITLEHQDLELFYGGETKTLTVAFETLRPVYNIINLPKNAKQGYYYLSDNKHYINIEFTYDEAEEAPVTFEFLKILKNKIYVDETEVIDSVPVLSYSIIKDSRDIELLITGISRELRGNTIQLTVSNDSTMNSVVQKMLMSVRYF